MLLLYSTREFFIISACLEHIDSSANANANVFSDTKRYWNVIATHCSYDGLSVIKVIICVAIKFFSSLPFISSSFVIPYCVKPLLEKFSSPVNTTISGMDGESFGPTQFTTNTTILDVKRAYSREKGQSVSAAYFYVDGNEEEISNETKIRDLLKKTDSLEDVSPANLSLSLRVLVGNSDAEVLMDFAQRSIGAMYQFLPIGRWSLQEWVDTPDVKDWRGVEIDEYGCVTGLDFHHLFGYEQIMYFSLLKDLHFLTHLNLSEFWLQEIPNSISEIENLEVLDLSFNRIEGAIPDSLGKLKKLRELSLQSNRLSGPIPDSFRNLTNLDRLKLRNNIDMILPKQVAGLVNVGFDKYVRYGFRLDVVEILYIYPYIRYLFPLIIFVWSYARYYTITH